MNIGRRYKIVAEQVHAAAIAAGREPEDVKIIAVSKTHTADDVIEASTAGARLFGENKVQEGIAKIEEVGIKALEWHLIGHLQKNKARKAVRFFDVIHTVDSISLAKRLNKIAGEERETQLSVLAQINLAGEVSKSGIDADNIDELADFLTSAQNLKFCGLMTIPPFFDDPETVRPFFARLREIRDRLQETGVFGVVTGALSMGMSHDFRVAVDEGATHVRVGTAIFGARNRSKH